MAREAPITAEDIAKYMDINCSKTYWCNAGKHEDLNAKLQLLIPHKGPVENANLHPALETYRIACNCYYDLYNNGLGNRSKEFLSVFGFDAAEVGKPNYKIRHRLQDDFEISSVILTQDLIDLTEIRMDEIILAAYAEQYPCKGDDCPFCNGTGKRSPDPATSEGA